MTDIHTQTHRGVTIEIHHDDCPSDPFEHSDGHAPMIVSGADPARHFNHTGAVDDAEPDAVLAAFHALCNAYDIDPESISEAVMITCQDDGRHLPTSDDYQETFRFMIAEHMSNLCDAKSERLKAEAKAYRALGVPAHTFTRHGYCQGDTVTILIVHTPEFRKRVGSPEYDPASDDPALNGHDDMASQADYYAAWAFGDVYGFTTTHDATGEEGDSCWGFFGAYGSSEWDYMIEQAVGDADALADRIARRDAVALQHARPDMYQIAA